MAVREAEWTYSNDGRIAFVFLAFAIVLLALGLLAVTAFGSDAANGGVALLATAMFLLVFAILVFLPRLARRGAASFSVYSRRSVDEAVKALSEHGQGFTVAPSYGSVVMPTEASDVSAAFQLADKRLYGHKGSRRRTRDGEQVRDALMQALRERRPDLDEHIGGVARFAHAVARRLGMSDTEVDEVTRAAEPQQ